MDMHESPASGWVGVFTEIMILDRLKNAARALVRVPPAARSVVVLEDDIFLVSYPKSGNTWLRFLIANLKGAGNVDFSNIEELVPDIYRHTNEKLMKFPRPRVLKSHEYLDLRYPKVIYLVRDPRDVVLSYFHHVKKFLRVERQQTEDEFVESFIAGRLDGYGTWGQHVGAWRLAKRGEAEFLMIRYEDLQTDPKAELTKIAAHVGINSDREMILSCLRLCDFDRMKEMELDHGKRWQPLAKTCESMPFVRKGRSGGWREELKPDLARRIESAWGDLMSDLGYL